MSDIDQMNLGPRWYVAHTYSGYENKVKDSLEKIVENRGLGHLIFDVKIPMELTLVTNEKGEQKEVESKVFPAYVLIKMVMTDASWHVVRNITGVTGFVGPGSRPVPLTEEEVEKFNVEPKAKQFEFSIGDEVSVVAGNFVGYSGKVQEVSEDGKQLTLLISTGKRDIAVIVDAKEVTISK